MIDLVIEYDIKVMEVFVKAAEFLEIQVRRSDDEPLHKLFMIERSELSIDLKNIKKEHAKIWKQHLALVKESSRSFTGEKGYSRLKNLQRLLRMRQQYMVSQVSLLYPLKVVIRKPPEQELESFRSSIKSGKTKVFLRAGQMADLDARRALILSNAAKKIQRNIITHIARSHFLDGGGGSQEGRAGGFFQAVETPAPEPPFESPKDMTEEKAVIAPPAEYKPDDDCKALAIVKKPEAIEEKKPEGSINRDAVLAQLATEKRMSLIRAWEESEKSKAENKAQKKMSSIAVWENCKTANLEVELKKIEIVAGCNLFVE